MCVCVCVYTAYRLLVVKVFVPLFEISANFLLPKSRFFKHSVLPSSKHALLEPRVCSLRRVKLSVERKILPSNEEANFFFFFFFRFLFHSFPRSTLVPNYESGTTEFPATMLKDERVRARQTSRRSSQTEGSKRCGQGVLIVVESANRFEGVYTEAKASGLILPSSV